MADANIIVKIVDQTRGGVGSVTKQISNLENSVKNSSSALDTMQKRIVAVGAAIAGSFVVKSIIETTARFEELQGALDVVAGSAKGGADAFKLINDFATQSIFGVEELTESYIKLKGAGIEPTTALLTTFSDTASVTTDKLGTLQALTDLFARTTAGGLGLEELNRVADRVPGTFQIIEQQLGITRLEVSEFGKTSEGARQIVEALIRGLNQKFGGATQDRLDDLSIALSNFGIKATDAQRIFGEGFAPELARATRLLTEFIAKNEETIRALGELVGQGLSLVIENLDKVAIATGLMIAGFSVKAIAAAATGLASLTKAVKLLNAAILANPIARVVALMATALTGVYVYWDDLKRIANNALQSMKIAYLEFVKGFTEWFESTINGAINGFENMATKVGASFKAIAAAIKDPMNATEAFNKVMEEAEKTIANNTDKTVDFSKKLESLDKRIENARNSMIKKTDATEEDTDAVEDNTDAAEDNTDATDENTDAIEDNEKALEDQIKRLGQQYKAYGESRMAALKAAAAVDDNIQAIENETLKMDLNESQRDTLNRLIQLEEENRKNLGLTTVKVSADQEAAIMSLLGTEELYTSDLLSLTAEQIQAFESAMLKKQAQAENTIKQNEIIRQAERERADFQNETEQQIRTYYEATTSKVQQLEDSKQEYIKRARELGLENNKETQDAILSYNMQINDAMQEDYEDLMAEQKRLTDEFRGEFKDIYDDIYGVIEDWTGLSMRELEKYNTYAKFIFGVDVLGAFNGWLDGSLMGMSQWNKSSQQQFIQWGTGAINSSSVVGDYMGNTIFGQNGYVAQQGIGGFVSAALNAFGVNGGGLLGAVMSLFGGLGNSLTSLFGDVFGFIGNGLGGIGGFLGDVLGFAGNAIVGGITTVGSLLGDLAGGILSIFGFDKGGYIGAGQVGIVGEYGPELVRGPATVTGREDTAALMAGGGVNVTFNINAVDAKGVDDLLIQRKPLIADIIRDAVGAQGVGV